MFMADVFEQFSLFDSPASDVKNQTVPVVHPSPSQELQLPTSDPRNALDESQVSSQAILLLRGLNYSALKHSNLSHKYKLVKLLACEAKIKAGLISPTHSVRNAYMTLLKETL